MIKGTTITLGEKDYCCPAMCLDDVQTYLPKIKLLQASDMSPEHFQTIKEVVLAALKRNYPDITLEEISKGLDLDNYREVLDAVMARSGLVKKVPGEVGAAVSS